ncbi:hypothetical protein HYS48_02125 [Candidatus Woesearchaeota archaeon]|nr:hypothetical protein [Candidatus Woesearchaeota archaeon]
MVTEDATEKRVVLLLCKDFSRTHTITSLAKELDLSRVGMWKVLRKLEKKGYLYLETVGSGKTSTYTTSINWENILVEKTLALYLTEEAVKQRRWGTNLAALEKEVDFTILFGSILYAPQQANDVDIINVAKKNRFVKIQKALDIVQKTQAKKIHAMSFTTSEFRQELKNANKAFIDAIKKGIVLFGQENFVAFMKGMHGK